MRLYCGFSFSLYQNSWILYIESSPWRKITEYWTCIICERGYTCEAVTVTRLMWPTGVCVCARQMFLDSDAKLHTTLLYIFNLSQAVQNYNIIYVLRATIQMGSENVVSRVQDPWDPLRWALRRLSTSREYLHWCVASQNRNHINLPTRESVYFFSKKVTKAFLIESSKS